MFEISALGDLAVHVQFGSNIQRHTFEAVQFFYDKIRNANKRFIVDIVPAYHSITVYYTSETTYAEVAKWLNGLCSGTAVNQDDTGGVVSRLVELPVCYGGEYGVDIDYVAEFNGITEREVIKKHSSTDYMVYLIGGMPGFPYLGELDPSLATPRKDKPRLSVPAGSVGIAGNQTGVYPIETPGGWQLIGCTPLKLFDPAQTPPTLLQRGDRVRFVPISQEQFRTWKDSGLCR